MWEVTTDFKGINQTAACEVNKAFKRSFLPLVYMFAFVVGFSSNCSVLLSLCLKRRKWASLDMFFFNLALADLLYVSTLPFLVVYYGSQRQWVFGKVFCRITRLVFHLNLSGSIGFLTCISVQRYLGIVHPMRMMGKWNRRDSVLVSALVWGLVLTQTSLELHFTKTNANATTCHDTAVDEELEDYLLYTQVTSVTAFLIPLLAILTCYCQIAVVLTRNKNLDISLKERSRNLAIVVMVLFSVCFTPYHVLRYLNIKARYLLISKGICTRSNTLYLSYQVSRGLATFNSCIDPLVYLVARDNMITKIKALKEKLHLCVTLTQASHPKIPQRILITDTMTNHNETTV
ncbi:P2Y purinoceptor 1-like [Scyliorhinus canicula]|uniref:P2Y purinoceptor 1-like n=1 Tax=Scyliorhinus canicula TaxID=7830 RepID=UPI0018F40AF0|nr:P2Y purinoceptor 1-like [Scyliorhinus canicula]